ncbi:hypothetical protein Ais01nite_23980 [Asanoa ishikariensis]|uniref:LPXTG-motif cell wall anchor domain-containing protein n=1 Tax=Asanoa ishikariensis TaxID=137265 RepID=A0A1H3R6S2_9ACTN|nr:LPXTG cell wall anchor domain-containing protein [Asanoa ishikariensis]GIF64363.1 hypothetical protein Ais01nite_23980 [Asanoa ishikariensis]SDZ21286.1 LPXTG-motif cell wall anchor domain-containing protein [Asanoa ishikariensis]
MKRAAFVLLVALGVPAVAAVPGPPAQAAVIAPTPGPSGARVDLTVRIAPNPSTTPTTPPPTTAPPTTEPPDEDPGGGDLPRTGAAIMMIALVGGLFVAGGVLLRVLARRRADAERWMAR